MARVAVAPDGRVWKVRRLLFRSPRWRGPRVGSGDFTWLDVAALDTAPGFGLVGLLLVAVVGLALAVVFLLPLVLLALEALVFAGAVGFKILFRRPWAIEAASRAPREVRRFQVTGWKRSGEVVEEIAEAIEQGSIDSPFFRFGR